MEQRQQMLAIATAELGYREGSNNDSKYGKWYGLNHQPWCMMFISWCAAHAGISSSIIPRESYCPSAVSWFKNRGIFIAAGRIPQSGDIIFFDANANQIADHVGLVLAVEGDYLLTIEGNRSDRVARHRYHREERIILGYGRPAYEGGAMMSEPALIDIKHKDSKQIIQVSGFNLGGSNYIALRDVEKLAPLIVEWDEIERLPTISINYRNK